MAHMGPGWSLSSGRAQRGPGGRDDEVSNATNLWDATLASRVRGCAAIPKGPHVRLIERRRGGLLFLEQSRTADEWTAPNIKSQETVCLARNADPDALADLGGLVIIASEP
jgi:hypothetical protein